MNLPRRSSGFTLVELMFTVAILAIVIGVGVPSFNSVIKNYRITTAANDAASLLQFARAEAVRLGGGVRVDALEGGITNGLRVWIDENSNNSYDSGEELRVISSEFRTLDLTADIGGNSTPQLGLVFNARGETDLGNKLTVALCDDRSGNHGRALEVLVSGSMRLLANTVCAN